MLIRSRRLKFDLYSNPASLQQSGGVFSMRSPWVPKENILVGVTEAGSYPRIGTESSNSTLSKLDNDSKTSIPSSEPSLRSNSFFRFLRLQILLFLTGWSATKEPRKIAIHQDRRVASLHLLLHLPPLAGAITLIFLNFTTYFVGDFNHSTALQFAAKLLELFIQAAIADVLFTFVRIQATRGFIHLGALVAPLNALQVSYLWSLEFWSTIPSQAMTGYRKLAFLVFVPLLVLLGALVGPSSAVAMIPRPEMSHLVSSSIISLNGSITDIFPTRVDSTYNMTVNLDFFLAVNRQASGDSQVPEALPIYNQLRAPRLLRLGSSKKPAERPFSLDAWTATAKIPSELAAEHLQWRSTREYGTNGEWRPLKISNLTASVLFPYPDIVVRCTPQMDKSVDEHLIVRYIMDDGHSYGSLASFQDIVEERLAQNQSNTTMIDAVPPFWTQSPEPGSHSLIGTFVRYEPGRCQRDMVPDTFPLSEAFNGIYPRCLVISTCSISASWAWAEHRWEPSEDTPMVRSLPVNETGPDFTKLRSPITIDVRDISDFHSPRLNHLFDKMRPSEAALAGLFAFALSGIPRSDTSWGQELRASLGAINSPFIFNGSMAHFKVNIAKTGYGYGSSLTTVRLSLAVLCFYCLVDIGYILFLFVTGTASTAWDSAVEFLLLALQSRPAHHLGFTSVGAETMATLKEPVGIRVNHDNDLELIFMNDPHLERKKLKKLERNKAY